MPDYSDGDIIKFYLAHPLTAHDTEGTEEDRLDFVRQVKILFPGLSDEQWTRCAVIAMRFQAICSFPGGCDRDD